MSVAMSFEETDGERVTVEMIRQIERRARCLPGAANGTASWVADVISDACAILPRLLDGRHEVDAGLTIGDRLSDRIALAVHTAWVESVRRNTGRTHTPEQAATVRLRCAPDPDELLEQQGMRVRVARRVVGVSAAPLVEPSLHPVLRLALAWAQLTPRQQAVLDTTMDVQPDLPTDHARNDHNPFRPRTGEVVACLDGGNPRSRRPVQRMGEEQHAAYAALCAALCAVDEGIGYDRAVCRTFRPPLREANGGAGYEGTPLARRVALAYSADGGRFVDGGYGEDGYNDGVYNGPATSYFGARYWYRP